MDGVSLSSYNLRLGRFILRIHDDQPNTLQHHVEQISHGVYGKWNQSVNCYCLKQNKNQILVNWYTYFHQNRKDIT